MFNHSGKGLMAETQHFELTVGSSSMFQEIGMEKQPTAGFFVFVCAFDSAIINWYGKKLFQILVFSVKGCT